MTQPEAKLSRDIMRELRLQGWFCWKVHGSELTMAGLPDIICCAEGVFVGLETKMPGKESNTSARQKYVHGEIQAAGGTAEVVSSVVQAVRAVRRAISKGAGATSTSR